MAQTPAPRGGPGHTRPAQGRTRPRPCGLRAQQGAPAPDVDDGAVAVPAPRWRPPFPLSRALFPVPRPPSPLQPLTSLLSLLPFPTRLDSVSHSILYFPNYIYTQNENHLFAHLSPFTSIDSLHRDCCSQRYLQSLAQSRHSERCFLNKRVNT